MIRINLLPRRRRRRRLVPEFGVVSVVLLVIGALVGSYFYFELQNRLVQDETAAISAKIAENKPKVAAVLAMEAKIEDLQAREHLLLTLEAREIPWTEVLTDLAARTPRDAWLGGASVAAAPGQPGRLTLSGAAMSYDAVGRFITNLAGSRFYSDVDLQSAQATTVGNTEVVQFGLLTTLRPAGAVAREGAR